MQNPHRFVLPFVLAGLFLVHNRASAQTTAAHAKSAPYLLSLTRADNGKRVHATVGQTIQIDLQTFQGAGYGAPQISPANIQFDNYVLPGLLHPGGPQPIYMFEALAPGVAQIQIPTSNPANQPFVVTIEVRPRHGRYAQFLHPDQMNDSDEVTAWTNLVNDARQTFVPTLPKLTRVEVRLTLANPGPEEGSLSLNVFDPQGTSLVIADKTVPASAPGWVSFVFANGGLDVTPGRPYSIRISGGTLFGWSYVVSGYANGEALFNHKPLLPQARSTFLFRTYGTR